MAGLALYRAFEIGKMAVVAPLSASYPALTLLLSWMSGERLSVVRIAGIVCTLVGVVVVAGGEKTPDENDAEAVRRSGRGLGWAMFSSVGFAVLFWLLGIRVIPRVFRAARYAGWPWAWGHWIPAPLSSAISE
jgi:drug/metabolite transporter (DMT)-like permease